MPFIVRKALDIAIPLIMIKNVKHTTKTGYGEASPFVIKNPEKPSATGWSLSSERGISYLLKEARKNADSSRSASRPAPPRPASPPRPPASPPRPPASPPRPPSFDLPSPEFSIADHLSEQNQPWGTGFSPDVLGEFSPLLESPTPISDEGFSEGDLDGFLGDLDGFF